MSDTLVISCACGWSSSFTAAQRGLRIDCPQCGQGHRLPMFGAAGAAVDVSPLAGLTGAETAPSRVAFSPLLLLSLFIAVAACAISLPLLWNHWPVNVAIAGGALSWPVAVAMAWLGQVRQFRKIRQARIPRD